MENNKHNRRFLTLLIALMCTWVLSGCGSDPKLDTYKQNMEVYFQGLSTLNDRINSIDPSTDTDGVQLLGYLDQLDNITRQMADLEVPEQFQLVESLADEAAQNMTQAVSLYHEMYESDEYNPSLAEGAYEYYVRANKRIGYIRSILQGNIPEELQIVEGDDSTGTDTDVNSTESLENTSGEETQYYGAEDSTETEDEYEEYEYNEGEDDSLQYLDVEE